MKCENCQKGFTPRDGRQKFCTRDVCVKDRSNKRCKGYYEKVRKFERDNIYTQEKVRLAPKDLIDSFLFRCWQWSPEIIFDEVA